MKEKRKNIRYRLSLSDNIKIYIENKLPVTPLNISKTGFAFMNNNIDNLFLYKKSITINIQCPENDLSVQILTNVVWNLSDCTGVKFLKLNSLQKNKIDFIIKKYGY